MPPLLDVSFVLEDPMLADVFTVLRYKEAIGTNGRLAQVSDGVFPNTLGVVTRESPSEIMRNPDLQNQPRKIFVATQFKLRGVAQDGVATNYQPDVLVFDGDSYTVDSVLSYSRYGAGFVEVVAISRKAVDLAPPPEEV